jgi:hypothetical protein
VGIPLAQERCLNVADAKLKKISFTSPRDLNSIPKDRHMPTEQFGTYGATLIRN